jgi:hypothetical protein
MENGEWSGQPNAETQRRRGAEGDRARYIHALASHAQTSRDRQDSVGEVRTGTTNTTNTTI